MSGTVAARAVRARAHARRIASAARACGRSIAAAALIAALATSPALADWLSPDPSYREAQLALRAAIRDTLHHGNDPVRLDSLGVSLLRLGRFDEATKVFEKALAIDPEASLANAGLGKIALFQGRLEEAERRLAVAAPYEPGAVSDLFAARIRLGKYDEAAAMAPDVNQEGRADLLRRMAETEVYRVTAKKPVAEIRWKRSYPVPLVRVKLNGRHVLMAIDTGAADLLIDDSAARRDDVAELPSQSQTFWAGARVAVQNAIVQKLEIGGIAIENVPAGVTSLRKWSLEVNPRGERVAGIIGLELLRRFTPTLDYATQRLVLRTPEVAWTPAAGARRVPFEMWGENELTVYGSLAGGRRMAMVVQTGVPGCGVGAPREVMEEIGVKPGAIAKLVKGAGQWLQGVPWSPVTVPTVAVGPVVEGKVPGWQDALSSSELWRHGVRRDALLSHDFFAGKRVTIDWKARELVFE